VARGSVIGLDIGGTALRAAELSFPRSGVTLERLAQVLLPPGAVRDGEVVDVPVVAAALRQMWRAERFSSKRVHLGVANQRVIVREVDLPEMPASDLVRALPFQVQDVLPIAVDSAILDFHPVERLRSHTGAPLLRGLLVAAVRDMVLANVRAVEAAGLVVESVDLTPFALMRSVGGGVLPGAGVEAIVEVGAHVTNVVVQAGGVPHFVRVLMSGGQHLTDAVAERLGVPAEEAERLKRATSLRHGEAVATDEAVLALQQAAHVLIEQLRSSLDYYASSNPTRPVERLVLGGGAAHLDGLAELVESAVRLPVVAADPLARLRVARRALAASEQSSSLAAVPVGLALGAAL